MTKLEEVDRDQTCLLGVAGDVVMMLIDGLLGIEGVEKCLGEVESAEFKVCSHLIEYRSWKREEGADGRMINGLSLPTLREYQHPNSTYLLDHIRVDWIYIPPTRTYQS
jgi:hypothetical protein